MAVSDRRGGAKEPEEAGVAPTRRSPSTTYVPSNHIGYNPTLLDMRNHHSNAIRCVGVGEECDGEVMQLLRGKVASDVFRGNICF